MPAANSPLLLNPDLKKVLAIHTSGGLQDPILSQTINLQTRLAANGVPVIVDNFNGGHEWHVWRLNLREFASKVAFRSTRTEVTPAPGNRLDVDGDGGDRRARGADRHGHALDGRAGRGAGRRQGRLQRPGHGRRGVGHRVLQRRLRSTTPVPAAPPTTRTASMGARAARSRRRSG